MVFYLELRDCFRLRIIWVSGASQISSGIYGFSRVCLTDGMASSGSILDFVPLNETAFERSSLMLPWVRTGVGVNSIVPLTLEGWFKECHGMKVGNNNYDGIWMRYHSKSTFYGRPPLWWQIWC